VASLGLLYLVLSLHTYTNAEIQFLTTPLSLPAPDTHYLPLCQRAPRLLHRRARALFVVSSAGACESRSSTNRRIDGWSGRRRHISPDLDGGSTASTGGGVSTRRLHRIDGPFHTVYTPTHYRCRRHGAVHATGAPSIIPYITLVSSAALHDSNN